MDMSEIMCMAMMHHDAHQSMMRWQESLMYCPSPDAYQKYYLYHTDEDENSLFLNETPDYTQYKPNYVFEPLPIYYQISKPVKNKITRETCSTRGTVQTRFCLNEIRNHNFILNCYVAKDAIHLTEKIYSQLDDILQNIYDDTAYIVAYVDNKSAVIDSILIDYGFKKITEHGDNDTFLLD